MFQVKHKILGLFQGKSERGMLFWHPVSDTPELGVYQFKTEDEATVFVSSLMNFTGSFRFEKDDLTIEEFDKETDKKIKFIGEYINNQLKSQQIIQKKAGHA